jgi:hypothetical protein
MLDRDISQIPTVIFADNLSKRLRILGDINHFEVRRRIVGDAQVHQQFIKCIEENRDKQYAFLPTITGYRRQAIFNHLLRTSFGLAFYGVYALGSDVNPFSGLIINGTIAEGDSTLCLVRRYIEEQDLNQAKYLAVSCIFSIESDLRKSKFKNNDASDKKVVLNQLTELIKTKTVRDRVKIHWKRTCDTLVSEIDNELLPVIVQEKYWRKRLAIIVPTDLYLIIVDNCVDLHLQTCYDIAEKVIKQIFKLPDDYEFQDDEIVDKVEDLGGPSMGSSRDQEQESEPNVMYSRTKLLLRDIGEELKKRLNSQQVLSDVYDKMVKILQKIAPKQSFDFTQGVGLTKEDVTSLVLELLVRLRLCRFPKSTKRYLDNAMFSVNHLLKQFGKLFQEIIEGTKLDASKASSLKGRITKWKNAQYAKNPPQVKITTKTFQQGRDWVEFRHDQVDLSEERHVNIKTLRAKEASDREIGKTGLPKDPPTQHFKNFAPDSSSVRATVRKDSDPIIYISIEEEESTEAYISILLYANWNQDLVQLLQNTNEKKIYPIFMPSYKRSKKLSNNVFFRKESDDLEDFSALIYLVVEEQEAQTYRTIVKNTKLYKEKKVVIVSIPDKNRGIGFSRAMINLLQSQMASLLAKEVHVTFDWFWMIDDDLVATRMFNVESTALTMTSPCTTALALMHTQNILMDKVHNEAKSVTGTEDIPLSEIFREVLDELNNDDIDKYRFQFGRVLESTATIKKFMELRDTREAYNYLNAAVVKDPVFKNVADRNEWFTKTISFDKFDHWFLNSFVDFHKSIGKVVQIAIVSSRMNDGRNNYNFWSRQQSHYRVSAQRHACVFNYAPGIAGYNYLTWDQLILNQIAVNRNRSEFDRETITVRENRIKEISNKLYEAKEEFKKGSIPVVPEYKYGDYFLGEDKKFVERLDLDNKGGYQVFYFDIVWGKQKTGGCYAFRKTHKN